MSTVDIEQILRDTGAMKPLPQTAMRLTRLLASDGWNIGEVVDLIRYDPVITAQLLKRANAAFAAPARAVTDVQTAVARVGPHAVAALAIGSAVRDELTQAAAPYGFREGELWYHAVSTALAAEHLHRFVPQAPPAEAFTAALLHDIGKLVLARYIQPGMLEAQRGIGFQDHQGRALQDLERSVLGIDHAEVGGRLVEHYGMPPIICQAVRHHHDPWTIEVAEHRQVAEGVYLANAAANVSSRRQELEPTLARIQQELPQCGIAADGFEALCTTVNEQIGQLLEVYAG